MTKAFVLAAGEGKRFLPFSEKNPKPLFKIGEISLIERIYEIYQSIWQEMTKLISIEMGAPLDWSSSAQTASGADHIKDFIKRLKEFEFELEFNKDSNNYTGLSNLNQKVQNPPLQ